MTTSEEAVQLDGVAGWTVDVMERFGGPGAGFAVFIENLFPPIPSEVILPMAGFAARLGQLSLLGAITWTTAGSVVSAWLLYGLGAWLGHARMRHLIARMPLVNIDDVDKSTAWFQKHGHKAVFFGRMIPVFRSFISVPAGAERMSFLAFTALTLMGSLIWNSTFIFAGYALGANWHRIQPYTSALQYAVTAAVVLGVGWFVGTRVRQRRQAAD